MRIHTDEVARSAGLFLIDPISAADEARQLLATRKALGDRIAALRKRRYVTIEAFAQAAGLNAAYAWRVEDGRQNLALTTLCRIAAALGVNCSDLFFDIEKSAAMIMASAAPLSEDHAPR